jgi:hypothetical protein
VSPVSILIMIICLSAIAGLAIWWWVGKMTLAAVELGRALKALNRK